jgi:hypothetical protein
VGKNVEQGGAINPRVTLRESNIAELLSLPYKWRFLIKLL